MSDLSPILLVLLLIASVVAVVFARRSAALESELRQEKQTVNEKKGDAEKARAQLTDMCEKLLANTVIERYDIEFIELEDG